MDQLTGKDPKAKSPTGLGPDSYLQKPSFRDKAYCISLEPAATHAAPGPTQVPDAPTGGQVHFLLLSLLLGLRPSGTGSATEEDVSHPLPPGLVSRVGSALRQSPGQPARWVRLFQGRLSPSPRVCLLSIKSRF